MIDFNNIDIEDDRYNKIIFKNLKVNDIIMPKLFLTDDTYESNTLIFGMGCTVISIRYVKKNSPRIHLRQQNRTYLFTEWGITNNFTL